MRTLVFYLSLFCILLSGKQLSYAGKSHAGFHTSSHGISQNQKFKFDNSGKNHTVIENADFDLEEDQLHGDDFNEANHYCKAAQNETDCYNWYWAYCQFFTYNNNAQRSQNLPTVCVTAEPIYITQRVLRI